MPRRIYSPTEKADALHANRRNGNLGVGHPSMELPRFQPIHPPKIANFANKQPHNLPVSPINWHGFSSLCSLCLCG